MTFAYEYIERNQGVDMEPPYPYERRRANCRFRRDIVGANITGFMEIKEGSELAVKQVVANIGPVAAGVDASLKSFMFYKTGVYYDRNCSTEPNHAVVIVGYGKTSDGEEYWICKNSWDTDWGEDGYIRIARNKNNHCGIASLASFPIVSSPAEPKCNCDKPEEPRKAILLVLPQNAEVHHRVAT